MKKNSSRWRFLLQVGSKQCETDYDLKVQDLPKDRNILCKNCDGLLGLFEMEVANSWDKLVQQKPKFVDKTSSPYVTIRTLNPCVGLSFRLLALACLFRAHFSSIDFCKEVDLGPYAEELKNELFHQIESRSWVAVFFAETVDHASTNYLVVSPFRHRGASGSSWIFQMGPFFFCVSLKGPAQFTQNKDHIQPNEKGLLFGIPQEHLITHQLAVGLFSPYKNRKDLRA